MNKDEIRSWLLDKRDVLKNRSKKENLIINKLNKFEFSKNEVISGYISHKSEVNIFSFLKKLSKKNFKICYPFILKKNHHLLFKKWVYGKTKLILGRYKIPTPQNDNFILPSVLFIPLVGFDVEKNRIGYGGGFYDRTINFLKKKKNILSIGIGFDEQEFKNIPVEKNDMKLDMIITQTRIIK